MIILGMVASKVETRTLLAIAAVCGSLFFGSIGIFESIHMMLVGQVLLAAFLAVLLGIGISYFKMFYRNIQAMRRLCSRMQWLSVNC